MYKIAIQYRNNPNEIHNRLVKSMPVVGNSLRLSLNHSHQFFHKVVRVVDIQHTLFVEKYLNDYHVSEPDAIIIIEDVL